MNRIAQKLALKVKHRRQRHSCIILKGGRILSQANNDNGRHAEQNALGHYVWVDRSRVPTSFSHADEYNKYKGATLISFRITPHGEIGKSKPCKNCQTAIQASRIRKVIYFDGKVWREEFL